MVADSPENFRVTRELDFTVQGMASRQRRKAQRMEPGDRLLFYITGVQKFGATATVTSKCFEDHKPVWKSEGKADDFPWRVNIKAEAILDEDKFLNAMEIGPRMEYIRHWPPELWPLAFQGNLHILPKNDFELLEREIKRAAGQRLPAPAVR